MHMVTLNRSHGSHGDGGVQDTPWWAFRGPICQVAEPARPVAVVPLDESDWHTDEGLAQMEATAAPLDIAIDPDTADDDAVRRGRARDRVGTGAW